MTTYNISRTIKKQLKNQNFVVPFLVSSVLIILVVLIFISQYIAEKGSIPTNPKSYADAKIAAEIKQIRSDTSGSLFWLKLIALFVTVGGAVGGYLLGQSDATRKRIAAEDERNEKRLKFEHRKDVDTSYQAIVSELSSKETILRATAAVKLGSILQTFPAEWDVSNERKTQLIQLTKQVLAAALSIEKEDKVLKTITIALILDKSLPVEIKGKKASFADVRGLDLSGANAKDAYWAKSDFSNADFFCANLSKTSFRNSILKNAQFREANLIEAVLIDTICENTNFEGAKVKGMKLTGAVFKGIDTNVLVDSSEKGDGSTMVKLEEWLQLVKG
jgi:hypothetical protein